jgi:hypothetical protein
MKKLSLLALSAALILGASCKKKSTEVNTTPPTITLSGASTVTVPVGTPYLDAGASAVDFNGNAVNVTTDASNVDANTAGNYQVVYSATDCNENFAQKSRNVNVEITTQHWVGSWNVVHNFNVCTPSASILGATATITEFGGTLTIAHQGSGSSQDFTGTITGTNVALNTIPMSINLGACTYDANGNGTISNDGQTITMTYNRTGTQFGSTNGSHTATYTKQ